MAFGTVDDHAEGAFLHWVLDVVWVFDVGGGVGDERPGADEFLAKGPRCRRYAA
jgi:hypothetical protein